MAKYLPGHLGHNALLFDIIKQFFDMLPTWQSCIADHQLKSHVKIIVGHRKAGHGGQITLIFYTKRFRLAPDPPL